ncbi:MAG: 50S ribosomal protein L5 [Planctomycetes bacterium DG_23]|nr:MAG: 50S ribosomal protein L5 [Planctomycetes bacterium DG_23]
MSRLLERYKNEIVTGLMEELGYKNALAVPRLEKVVINMGVGKSQEEKKRLEDAAQDLAMITGQRPVITKARRSVAGFKVRKGNPVGLKVTLRGVRMYEFLDRLISIAIPRIRDFRGLKPNSFDGRGNYTLGIDEQSVFPEVDLDHMEFTQGMDITIVTTARSDEEALRLLSLLGMPFAGA